MTPQRALFRKLYIECSQLLSTYDFLEKEEVPYPFAYIGESIGRDYQNNDLYGELNQTIHIYAERDQASVIDTKIIQLHNVLAQMTEAFDYNVRLQDIQITVIPNNTGIQSLQHVWIECIFTFKKKRKKQN